MPDSSFPFPHLSSHRFLEKTEEALGTFQNRHARFIKCPSRPLAAQ
jgi:hypothetical protein